MYNLDLSPYIASRKAKAPEPSQNEEKPMKYTVQAVEVDDIELKEGNDPSLDTSPEESPVLSHLPSIGGVLSTKDGYDESLYELFAVVHHLGALQAGHYVASVRSLSTGKWHCFNDGQVSVIQDEKELVNHTAYILFYVRKDMGSVDISDIYPSKIRSGSMTLEEIEELMSKRDSSSCNLM
eukprot:CAMPEP_0117827036 /NCGR_PEP_ID=MMETSP0949-20121206/6468_1 /TAXON_ID=44440 /ORGANISM="Chattonella subsalsa, Strain CCMP2191" /LENGTH=180 /DNA_ID=CAMNT_0005667393 /DNA_START=174 /DNA_END=716 /DNA_ORIENTATION=-